MLLKWVADRLAPEGGGGRVRQLLPDGPASREPSEQGPGRLRPDSAAPVLAQHEKFGDVAWLPGKDQGEAGQRALDPGQERLAVRIGPVLVEVPVQVLPVRIDVTAVELGEIVVIQLQQPTDDGPVVLERLDHLYVHPPIMPRSTRAGPTTLHQAPGAQAKQRSVSPTDFDLFCLCYCSGIGSLTAGTVGAGLSNTACWAARKLASAAARLTARFCDGQRAGLPGSRSDVVKSPQVARRQALMLGSDTPNRVAMRRISDVWSSTSEQT